MRIVVLVFVAFAWCAGCSNYPGRNGSGPPSEQVPDTYPDPREGGYLVKP